MRDQAQIAGASTEVATGRPADSREQAAEARVRARLFAPPTEVGRFRLGRRLGQGAMGVVYASRDPALARDVAIKLIDERRAGSDVARRRMVREAQAMARLSHGNVVHVYEVGEDGDRVYIAMELVAGETLTAWLTRDQPRRTWREIVELFEKVGQGLAAAHAAGVIHRDFKPDNVLVGVDGEPKVADFGLAGLGDRLPTLDESAQTPADAVDLTGTGGFVGTPLFMSPEQLHGRSADAASDQFAYCVSLWRALFGQAPFAGATIGELSFNVVRGRIQAPNAGHGVPSWVLRLCRRGLSVDPDQRWPSMDALVAEIRRGLGRRRARRWTATVAVGLVAACAATWWRIDAQRCTGAAEAMAEVWSAEQRSQIETAILGTDASYAPRVWTQIGPRLDTWATGWMQMHADACEATQRRGEQSEAVMDLRMACLSRARGELAAVTELLSNATPEVVAHAHELVGKLPPVSRCADVDALQADVAPPAPDEAETVWAARARIAAADARRTAGNLGAAEAALDEAASLASGLRYGPVRAELALLQGTLLDDRGKYAEAAEALRRAQHDGAASQRWDVVRDATNQLLFVVGGHQGRPEEAQRLLPLATGLTGDDVASQSRLHNGLGVVRGTQGRHVEAEAEYRTALELARAALDDQHPDIGVFELNVAHSLRAQGRYDEAEAQVRATLRASAASLGDDHPALGQFHDELGACLVEQGRYEEAEHELEIAIALRTAGFGARHPAVGTARANLAASLSAQGRHAEAEAEFRAALEILVEALGEEHPRVAAQQHNLADVLLMLGRHGEAEKEERAAIRSWEASFGPDHVELLPLHNGLCMTLQARGRYAEAEAECRSALEIAESSPSVDPSRMALARVNLALALRAQERTDEAEAELRRALATTIESLGAAHPRVAIIRSHLAHVLRLRGAFEEAEAEQRAALVGLEQSLGRTHHRVSAAHDVLASVLKAQGRYSEAEAERRVALETALAAHGDEHPRVASVRGNLALDLLALGRTAQAEAELRTALVTAIALQGEDHPDVATFHHNLGLVLTAQGRHSEAEAEHRLALTTRIEVLGEDDPRVAQCRTDVAKALLARGHRTQARPLLERTWSELEARDAPPRLRAAAAFALAEASWPSDRTRARALADTAAEVLAAAGDRLTDRDAAFLAEIDAWRARHR